MRAPTVIFQTFLVMALCWLIIDQAASFMRERARRQMKEAKEKGLDMLVTWGSVRRVR